MNFEGLFNDNSGGLALGLQANMEVHGDLGVWGLPVSAGAGSSGGGDADSGGRNKEEENESRSESDNLEAVSGDDLDNENSRKKKRYHRHTPQQIQELEALFKECPHPDEKQRQELSRRLNLDGRQVKFWFQNRRTQMKTQIERHENLILRQENEKLKFENITVKESMRNPICNNCGSAKVLGEFSLEEQQLRIENARLKDELERVSTLTRKFLGTPASSLSTGPTQPSSLLELGVGSNGFTGLNPLGYPMGPGPDYLQGIQGPQFGSGSGPLGRSLGSVSGSERSMLLEIALAAMDELVNLVQMEDPLWVSSLDGGTKTLNYDEYGRSFRRLIGMSPVGYVSEASKHAGMVFLNSLALVETFMDAARWADMFPYVIARTTVTDIITGGVGGTNNGSLQLMQAELQVLSPLVPVREVKFLRFAKQHGDGIWAIVDVSVDSHNGENGSFTNCRKLPSGCVVQDMSNGYSKVTWVEHAEYDESLVHQMYRPLLRSGKAFGARRWIAALQRQCECRAILFSSIGARDENETIIPNGKRSMLKLAQRMTDSFCSGVCPSSAREWSKLTIDSIGKDVRVMTRKSMNDPGEPAGLVLSAATSVWIPAGPQRLFDFLREGRLRGEWDILSNGGPMREMAHIAKGQDNANGVSLLRSTAQNQSSMLRLQETYTDGCVSVVVYAPVDIPAMHSVMNGGDSSIVALLPSGFAILPDPNDASLLTVAFQVLVNDQPNAKLSVESMQTVNNLITCTIQKIKAALNNASLIVQ